MTTWEDVLVRIGKATGAALTIVGGAFAFWRFVTPKIWEEMKRRAALTGIVKAHGELCPVLLRRAAALEQAVEALERRAAFSGILRRTLVDSCGLAVFQSDAGGSAMWVSPMYCRLIGQTESDCLGDNWINYIWPEDRTRVLSDWGLAVANNADFDSRYRMVGAEGLPVAVHCMARAAIFNGKFYGHLGLVTPEKEKS